MAPFDPFAASHRDAVTSQQFDESHGSPSEFQRPRNTILISARPTSLQAIFSVNYVRELIAGPASAIQNPQVAANNTNRDQGHYQA